MYKYTREITKQVSIRRLEQEIPAENVLADYDSLQRKANDFTFCFTTELDSSGEAKLDEVISQHNGAPTLRESLITQYKKRIKDGNDYAIGFTADLMIGIMNETYTDVEVFLVETHLKGLDQALKGGHWLSAQAANAALPLAGIYDQAMKDKIQGDIDQYVTDNY